MSASMERRTAFLGEMGLGPVWTLRDAAHAPESTELQVTELQAAPAAAAQPAMAPGASPAQRPGVKAAESAWSSDPLPLKASPEPAARSAPMAARVAPVQAPERAAGGPSPEEI